MAGNYTLTPKDMGHRVIQAIVLEPWRILLRLDPGGWRVLDCQPFFKGPALAQLADPIVFAKANIASNTITWPDEMAIDPDVAYWDSEPAEDFFARANHEVFGE